MYFLLIKQRIFLKHATHLHNIQNYLACAHVLRVVFSFTQHVRIISMLGDVIDVVPVDHERNANPS